MSGHYDKLETRSADERENALMQRLPALVAAALKAPGWREHLKGIDAADVNSREALAKLPVLRKSALPAMQKASPPFAGFVPDPVASFGRLFTSPGPIFEPEGTEKDSWRAARSLFAAGFRPGDIVLNTFSYHMTPGGFILDSAARSLGCPVIPAGPGQTEMQLEMIAHLQPAGYTGTPDFLKILLDAAKTAGRDVSCIKKALVSGAAFPPSLQAEVKSRGVDAYQTFATADLGVIAYESSAREGLIVNEDVLVEIVRPGTGDPVAEGEVGEIVVTSFNEHHPWLRLATGDLSAVMKGASPCGRTNARIKGWMGRADQTAKVKGMFIRPEQIAELSKQYPSLQKLRLVVTRENEQDAMTLKAESANGGADLSEKVAAALQAVTKLKGRVEIVAVGSLPNDGKVISDERA
ncbi:MAG: AMP-binding protein [Xanthobacteraceae bacterium]|nr:AMP-binding protein [Xanthobacteraceae bacterium]QYK44654.1 MAG: AMP-binding protein [Xanthobacteraceae bacterium]